MGSEDELDAEFALFESQIKNLAKTPTPPSSPSAPAEPGQKSPQTSDKRVQVPSQPSASESTKLAQETQRTAARPPPRERPATKTRPRSPPPATQPAKRPRHEPTAPKYDASAYTAPSNRGMHTDASAVQVRSEGRWKWVAEDARWVWRPDLPAVATNNPLTTPAQPSHKSVTSQGATPSASATKENDNTRKVPLRTAAGATWRDSTLLDFPENDHRLFVTDLSPDCTDNDLTQAFSKYPSFNTARAVKEKKSEVCKGYGFVSFADGRDMVKAMKEMAGKYVGGRPIRIRKSSWQKREGGGRGKEIRELRKAGRGV